MSRLLRGISLAFVLLYSAPAFVTLLAKSLAAEPNIAVLTTWYESPHGENPQEESVFLDPDCEPTDGRGRSDEAA